MEGDERVLFVSMSQRDRQRTEKGTADIAEIRSRFSNLVPEGLAGRDRRGVATGKPKLGRGLHTRQRFRRCQVRQDRPRFSSANFNVV